MAEMVYWGLFFEHEALLSTLEEKIEHPHITFGYKTQPPAHFFDILGSWATVDVIGYGKNEDNEGYAVSLSQHQTRMYQGASTPHITTSVSKCGRPKDTAKLNFGPYYEIVLCGRWGWFGTDGKVHFE